MRKTRFERHRGRARGVVRSHRSSWARLVANAAVVLMLPASADAAQAPAGAGARAQLVKDVNTMVRVEPCFRGAGSFSDIATHSCPHSIIDVNGTALFVASDFVNGVQQLWRSDGSRTGTFMVKDVVPNGAADQSIRNLTNVAGGVYFTADDGTHGNELWRSDGTSAGTTLAADINPGPASSQANSGFDLAAVGGNLFFVADDGRHGFELWMAPGGRPIPSTGSDGPVLVKDINPGPASGAPQHFADVGGTAFFAADDGAHGFELWKSDGTEAGTVLVKDVNPGPGPSFPDQLTAVGPRLFFTVKDDGSGKEGGGGLWTSDGTEAGTYLVRPGLGSTELTPVGGAVFFSAFDPASGDELWKSDGTVEGTVRVADINPGSGSSLPRFMSALGTAVVFQASDADHGSELWRSDGTEAGTVLVKDINPGFFEGQALGSGPRFLTNVGGSVFFNALDRTHGEELWKTDGTPAGTVLVADIKGGARSSNPAVFADVAGTAFFTADDGARGIEVWKATP